MREQDEQKWERNEEGGRRTSVSLEALLRSEQSVSSIRRYSNDCGGPGLGRHRHLSVLCQLMNVDEMRRRRRNQSHRLERLEAALLVLMGWQRGRCGHSSSVRAPATASTASTAGTPAANGVNHSVQQKVVLL